MSSRRSHTSGQPLTRAASAPRLLGVAAIAFTAALCPALSRPAAAITIKLNYDSDVRPSFDPTGQKLMTVARAAARRWEQLIEDQRTVEMNISWANLDGLLGKTTMSHLPFDTTDVQIAVNRNGSEIDWFFDPTPDLDEEYDEVVQTLVRDLNSPDIDEAFNGEPPAVLEAGAFAFAKSGTQASERFDLLTILMHEFGHELGMNYAFGSDSYDLLPATVGNHHVGAVEGPGLELKLESALMNDSAAVLGRRTYPSAVDVLATADQEDFSHFNLKRIDLLGEHSGIWSDTLNWIGGKLPSITSDVFIRSGHHVVLHDYAELGSLFIADNSQVLTSRSSRMFVQGKLQVGVASIPNTDIGSRGEIHIGDLLGNPSLDVASLDLRNGIVNLQSQGSSLVARGKLAIGREGLLMGGGRVDVGGDLVNDGEISAGLFALLGFGGDLYVTAYNLGKLDLDGATEHGSLSAVNGNLHVLSQLSESFDGTATIGAGRTMKIANPWTFGGNLALRGGATMDKAATLTGGEIAFNGAATVEQGIATIDSPLRAGQNASFRLKSGTQLNLVGHHIGPTSDPLAYAGTMTLEQNSWLNVNLSGNQWRSNNKITLAPGSTVYGDDILNVGVIEGSGNLAVNNVQNIGTLAPQGEMEIHFGSLTQLDGGMVSLDIAGPRQGVDYDFLSVGGNATLAGVLAVRLADDFLPAVGSLFDVLTAGNITGTFDELDVHASSEVEFAGRLLTTAGKVTFEVLQSNWAADFNADGVVDGGDMAAWNVASSLGAPGANGEGDADHDNDVDGADLLVLQRQLGRTSPTVPVTPAGPGVAGVPEPSTAVLAAGVLALAAFGKRRGAR